MNKSDGKFLDSCRVDETNDFNGPVSKALYEYWNEKLQQSGENGPIFSDIDLIDIYDIAPYIVVKDILNGGENYLNRYWGTGIAQAFGYDSTGMLLSDYYDDAHIKQLHDLYELIVSAKRPIKISGNAEFYVNKEYLTFESAHLPLYDNDGKPKHILLVYDFNI